MAELILFIIDCIPKELENLKNHFIHLKTTYQKCKIIVIGLNFPTDSIKNFIRTRNRRDLNTYNDLVSEITKHISKQQDILIDITFCSKELLIKLIEMCYLNGIRAIFGNNDLAIIPRRHYLLPLTQTQIELIAIIKHHSSNYDNLLVPELAKKTKIGINVIKTILAELEKSHIIKKIDEDKISLTNLGKKIIDSIYY
ncbi:MAG: hypothetical protein N3E37_02865 [Candidatus Micrarchaeota archaeon]|nr:hypothetical protein [Candidatus Micrarchaeota archaeon]